MASFKLDWRQRYDTEIGVQDERTEKSAFSLSPVKTSHDAFTKGIVATEALKKRMITLGSLKEAM